MFFDPENPIEIVVPGDPADPRTPRPAIPGLLIHYVPELHPDDVTQINGLRVTSASRTLIDLGETMTEAELRVVFARARELGQLDPDQLRAARARVEWRPSLALVDRVIADFV